MPSQDHLSSKSDLNIYSMYSCRLHILHSLSLFSCAFVREETHKVDVIKFAQNKAQECMRNDDLMDKDSAFLIWEFIILLCRQNGVRTRVLVLFSFRSRFVYFLSKCVNKPKKINNYKMTVYKLEMLKNPSLSYNPDGGWYRHS